MINGLTNGVSQQSCDPSLGYNSAICFAYNYLIGTGSITINGHLYPSLFTATLSLFTPLTLLYIAIGTISTINLDIIVVSIGLAGLKVFLGPLHGIVDFLAANMFLIVTQAALLRFIAVTAIPVVLPIGLILRTFYFTRRLGGTLIAIAIGFFAVFPLTYVLGAQLMDTYSSSTAGQSLPEAVSAIENATVNAQLISSGMFLLSKNAISVSYNSISLNPFSNVNGMISSFTNAFDLALNYLEEVVTFLVIQVFILLAFSLILTIISVRELAKIMGSEISFGRFDIF